MKIEIKNRWSDEIIIAGEYASIKDALAKNRDKNLSGAYLSGADLSGADLSRAYLFGANLSRANLSRADLSRANLSGADLSGADLYLAVGVNKYLTTPLYSMLDQVGKIRAYKLVDQNGYGPWHKVIQYEKGGSYEVQDADTNENNQCGAGVNLATLDWVLREYVEGYRILIAEFTRKDIACIPISSDGKFRVHRCKIVGEKNIDELLKGD